MPVETKSMTESVRAFLRDRHVPARVQTYRNHSDISIFPTRRSGGWTADEFAAVCDILRTMKLATARGINTGEHDPAVVGSAREFGFRYLRFIE